MVVDFSDGPALILGLGIFCDIRTVSGLVNSIRGIRGFLGGSVRTGKYLSIYICPRTCRGYSFSVANHVLVVSVLETHYHSSSSYRSNFRDGYCFGSAAFYRGCWLLFEIG